jgi:DNA gyrase subunit B
VFDNSLDEAMAGHADHIIVKLLPDSRVSVEDNGRGIPVEKHKQTGVSALETVMTTLHAGGKFGGEAYKVAGGLHGVGVSVVNALSSYLKAEVHRDGAVYEQEYVRGKPKKPVRKVGDSDKQGTVVTFEPDSEIFKERVFTLDTILSHLRQQAYLTKGITIDIVDARAGVKPPSAGEPQYPTYTFHFEGGIVSYVNFLNHGIEPVHKTVFYAAKQEENMFIEIALQYVDDLSTKEISFANNIHTTEGGMHMTGFKTALTRILNDYARKNGYLKEKDDNLTGDDVREGLVAIVSIKIASSVLQFEGQTKANSPIGWTAIPWMPAASWTRSSWRPRHAWRPKRRVTRCSARAPWTVSLCPASLPIVPPRALRNQNCSLWRETRPAVLPNRAGTGISRQSCPCAARS